MYNILDYEKDENHNNQFHNMLIETVRDEETGAVTFCSPLEEYEHEEVVEETQWEDSPNFINLSPNSNSGSDVVNNEVNMQDAVCFSIENDTNQCWEIPRNDNFLVSEERNPYGDFEATNYSNTGVFRVSVIQKAPQIFENVTPEDQQNILQSEISAEPIDYEPWNDYSLACLHNLEKNLEESIIVPDTDIGNSDKEEGMILHYSETDSVAFLEPVNACEEINSKIVTCNFCGKMFDSKKFWSHLKEHYLAFKKDPGNGGTAIFIQDNDFVQLMSTEDSAEINAVSSDVMDLTMEVDDFKNPYTSFNIDENNLALPTYEANAVTYMNDVINGSDMSSTSGLEDYAGSVTNLIKPDDNGNENITDLLQNAINTNPVIDSANQYHIDQTEEDISIEFETPNSLQNMVIPHRNREMDFIDISQINNDVQNENLNYERAENEENYIENIIARQYVDNIENQHNNDYISLNHSNIPQNSSAVIETDQLGMAMDGVKPDYLKNNTMIGEIPEKYSFTGNVPIDHKIQNGLGFVEMNRIDKEIEDLNSFREHIMPVSGTGTSSKYTAISDQNTINISENGFGITEENQNDNKTYNRQNFTRVKTVNMDSIINGNIQSKDLIDHIQASAMESDRFDLSNHEANNNVRYRESILMRDIETSIAVIKKENAMKSGNKSAGNYVDINNTTNIINKEIINDAANTGNYVNHDSREKEPFLSHSASVLNSSHIQDDFLIPTMESEISIETTETTNPKMCNDYAIYETRQNVPDLIPLNHQPDQSEIDGTLSKTKITDLNSQSKITQSISKTKTNRNRPILLQRKKSLTTPKPVKRKAGKLANYGLQKKTGKIGNNFYEQQQDENVVQHQFEKVENLRFQHVEDINIDVDDMSQLTLKSNGVVATKKPTDEQLQPNNDTNSKQLHPINGLNTNTKQLELISAMNTDDKQLQFISSMNTDDKHLPLVSATNTDDTQLPLISAMNTEQLQLMSPINTDDKQLQLTSAININEKQLQMVNYTNTDNRQLQLTNHTNTDNKEFQLNNDINRNDKQLQLSSCIITDAKELKLANCINTGTKQTNGINAEIVQLQLVNMLNNATNNHNQNETTAGVNKITVQIDNENLSNTQAVNCNVINTSANSNVSKNAQSDVKKISSNLTVLGVQNNVDIGNNTNLRSYKKETTQILIKVPSDLVLQDGKLNMEKLTAEMKDLIQKKGLINFENRISKINNDMKNQVTKLRMNGDTCIGPEHIKSKEPIKTVNQPSDVDDILKCSVCGEKFTEISKLITHRKTHMPFQCKYCLDRFGDLKELNGHMIVSHQFARNVKSGSNDDRNLAYQCNYCEKQFEEMKDLKIHLKTHAILIFEAPEEEEAVDKTPSKQVIENIKRQERRRPKKFVHNGKDIVCKYCDRRFNRKGDLKNHERYHYPDRIYKCSFCSIILPTKDEFNAHIKDHANTVDNMQKDNRFPFKCSECGSVEPSLEKLTAHIDTHQKSYYKCADCGSSFRHKDTFRSHMRAHALHDPARIEFTSGLSTSTDKRVLRDSGVKCNFCTEVFTSQAERNRHIKKHDEVEGISATLVSPSACIYCNTKLETINDIIYHIRIHTEERSKFPCSICDKKLVIEKGQSPEQPGNAYYCSYCITKMKSANSRTDANVIENDDEEFVDEPEAIEI